MSARDRRSGQLLAAALAIYGVALLIGFIVLIVQVVPPESVGVLRDFGTFLALLATTIMAVREWVKRRDRERL